MRGCTLKPRLHARPAHNTIALVHVYRTGCFFERSDERDVIRETACQNGPLRSTLEYQIYGTMHSPRQHDAVPVDALERAARDLAALAPLDEHGTAAVPVVIIMIPELKKWKGKL
jgi:hypothetical protein